MKGYSIQVVSVHDIYNNFALTLKQHPRCSFTFYSRAVLSQNHHVFKHINTRITFTTNNSTAIFALNFSTAHKISTNCRTISINQYVVYSKFLNFHGLVFNKSCYFGLLFLKHYFYFSPELLKVSHNLLNFSTLCVLKQSSSSVLNRGMNNLFVINPPAHSLILSWNFYRSTLANINLRRCVAIPVTVINKSWIF